MGNLNFSNNDSGIGVTVHETNLALDLNLSQIIQIQDLLNQFRVVIFPNQTLTDKQLKQFAAHFGSPFVADDNSPVLGSKDVDNSIIIVGNQALEFTKSYLGHQEVLPHSDHQWLKRPSSASLLYAVDIENNSSPTVWFDMVKAYDLLDSELQAIIADVRLITFNPFYRPFGSVSAKYVDRGKDVPPGEVFSHPLVRIHPLTQEKILYLNIAYELEFEDIRHDVGLELFRILRSHIENLNCRYEHQWKKGDLVFWDNRATIHYRPAFNGSVRRVLKRVTIAGEIPY